MRQRKIGETAKVAAFMPILPVLDLMHGQIVRGIAGERGTYRPIQSQLVQSAQPLAIAQAFRSYFGFIEFYLADLDAIQTGKPSLAIYEQLQHEGIQLWIDAGLHSDRDETLTTLIEAKVPGIIVGLESVAGPEELEQIVHRTGTDCAVFSLDLKAGSPLSHAERWHTADPWQIAEKAIRMGVRRLIVLDLARVGIGAGVGTETLCVRLKETYPHVQLAAGGGVRGMDDVRRFYAQGVDHVLIASALHDGRLTREDAARLHPFDEAKQK